MRQVKINTVKNLVLVAYQELEEDGAMPSDFHSICSALGNCIIDPLLADFPDVTIGEAHHGAVAALREVLGDDVLRQAQN